MTTEALPPAAKAAPPTVPFRWRLGIYAGLWVMAGVVIAFCGLKDCGDGPVTVRVRLLAIALSPLWMSLGLARVLFSGMHEFHHSTRGHFSWVLVFVLLGTQGSFTLATKRRRTFVILTAVLVVLLSIGVICASDFLNHMEDGP